MSATNSTRKQLINKPVRLFVYFLLTVWVVVVSADAVVGWVSPRTEVLPDSANRLDLVLVILAALGVLLALVTVLIALVAIVGWNGLQQEIAKNIDERVKGAVADEFDRQETSEQSGRGHAREYNVRDAGLPSDGIEEIGDDPGSSADEGPGHSADHSR